MIFFQNDYITIHYEPENKLAYTRWHQLAPSNEYRKALNKYLHLVKDYPVTHWIDDTTFADKTRPNDQDWTITEWLPNFARYGVKQIALLVPDEKGQRAVENLFKNAPCSVLFDVRFFYDLASARAWTLDDHQAAAYVTHSENKSPLSALKEGFLVLAAFRSRFTPSLLSALCFLYQLSPANNTRL